MPVFNLLLPWSDAPAGVGERVPDRSDVSGSGR